MRYGFDGPRKGRWKAKELEEEICNTFGSKHAQLTSSGTAALTTAMAALGIGAGDEVIMPSFTFVSTANAFVLRGATPVFVDVRPDTLNIDEMKIEVRPTNGPLPWSPKPVKPRPRPIEGVP